MNCVKSVFKNISGAGKFFAYLPPHGKYVENDQEVTIEGNIFDLVGRYDWGWNERARQAFFNDLQNGKVAVVSTPAPISNSKMITVSAAGSVVVSDPCWVSEPRNVKKQPASSGGQPSPNPSSILSGKNSENPSKNRKNGPAPSGDSEGGSGGG